MQNYSLKKTKQNKFHFADIVPALQYAPLLYFLIDEKLPMEILCNVYCVNPEKEITLKTQKYSQTDITGISKTDYLQAIYAQEKNIPVISFDHHLITKLPRQFQYETIYPVVVNCNPIYSVLLLDANTIIELLTNSKNQKDNLIKMLQITSCRFLLLKSVVDEILHVSKKLKVTLKDKQKQRFKTWDQDQEEEQKPKYRPKRKTYQYNRVYHYKTVEYITA